MLKLLSLFSGIGAFEKALSNIGEPFEVVRYCEIDKYASKAYSLIHNLDENMNLGDITQVDTYDLPDDIDIVTYGFPCQDISNAGKQKGFTDDNGELTRSGLFFEALRIIEDTQSYFAICENVKALTSKKFKTEFKIVLDSLNAAGYKNYWAVLNAKDYGIPQNRERVFVISIRDDIDHGYTFPEKYELKLRLKDLLEDEVDDKYYLKKTLNIVQKENYLQWDNSGKGYNSQQCRGYYQDGLCPTLSCCNNNGDKSQVVLADKAEIQRIDIPQTVKVRKYPVDTKKKLCELLREAKNNSFETNYGIAEALNITQTKVAHWFRQDDCFSIPDPEVWMQLKALLKIETDEFDESIMTFEEKEGVFEKSERHYFAEGIAPTLTSTSAAEKVIEPSLRIRKLTPKECFRFMGFDDCDIDVLIENGISNTQLYKMAGNSIVVDVLEEIFVELLNQYEEVFPYVG